MELRIGPPQTSKLPQSIQSPKGADLISNRDGRIELRAPSAPSARLAEDIRIYSRAWPTLGSNLRFCRSTPSIDAWPLRDPAESGRPNLAPTKKKPSSIAAEGPSRDGRIRTGDPLNPIQVRYRAAPRPVVVLRPVGKRFWRLR